MIEIDRYMDDGANWQAQSILAYLRAHKDCILDRTWNKEYGRHDASLQVGRLENCREQGYVFSVQYGFTKVKNFWVYEHRNCDSICIKIFDGSFINTPTIDDIKMKDKWDYDKDFHYGDILGAAKFICDEIDTFLDECIEKDSNES